MNLRSLLFVPADRPERSAWNRASDAAGLRQAVVWRQTETQ